jgi:hypothetical protein
LLEVEDAGGADAALTELAAAPKVVLLSDAVARRYDAPAWVNTARDRLIDGTAGPLSTALASMHPDGHVREAAVAAMARGARPEFVPFLVLRSTDWVGAVAGRARGALGELLEADPGRFLPVAAPIAALIGRRLRARSATGQVTAAVYAAPGPLLRRLIESADATLAIPALHAAVARRDLRAGDLAAIVTRTRDVLVARVAAEYAAREALWSGRHAVLDSLVASRTPAVRVLGLTGYVRAGQPEVAVGHLADDNALIRALARDAARRTGIDAAGWYRAAATVQPVSPGALRGLAECGTAADAEMLHGHLTDASPRVRQAAVHGLQVLDAVDPARVRGLLADPTGRVVDQTVKALRPHARSVPEQDLWAQLDSTVRIHRRAAYALLACHAEWTPLRAALPLTQDSDPALARRGHADATRLMRRHQRSDMPADLIALAEKAGVPSS